MYRFRNYEDPRWTTLNEIRSDIYEVIPHWLVSSIHVDDLSQPCSFTVTIRLKWWAYAGLGFVHAHYQSTLQERCCKGKPSCIGGLVVVK